MGKGPKLPQNRINKVRQANRKLIRKHKDLNAAVRAAIKASGKPEDKADKRKINKRVYRSIIGRNPLLGRAVKENVAKLR
jgi:replicative DNA helicase